MFVLGIDCSTKRTNVGISRDGQVLADINLDLGRAQSSKLPILIGDALSAVKIGMRELSLIAVANGPGYYTGIRTGIAYAAALARALQLKIVPLATTELMVYGLRHSGRLLAPVIRAKRGSIYAAVYSPCTVSLGTVMRPAFISAADFADMLAQYPDALLVGADAANYPELARLPNQTDTRASGSGGDAALMGELYRESAVAPEALRGNYLRKPDIGPG